MGSQEDEEEEEEEEEEEHKAAWAASAGVDAGFRKRMSVQGAGKDFQEAGWLGGWRDVAPMSLSDMVGEKKSGKL